MSPKVLPLGASVVRSPSLSEASAAASPCCGEADVSEDVLAFLRLACLVVRDGGMVLRYGIGGWRWLRGQDRMLMRS